MFDKFGIINYNGKQLTNLMKGVRIIRQRLDSISVFYDYVIKDGERPDTVAYDYYGHSDYAWLVCIINDIYDPYYDWPLTYRQFHGYLRMKYGEVETLKTKIRHYKFVGVDGINDIDSGSRGFEMTPLTFNRLTPEERAGWVPVDFYTWEDEINDSKRTIRLISNRYLQQIESEMQDLFK